MEDMILKIGAFDSEGGDFVWAPLDITVRDAVTGDTLIVEKDTDPEEDRPLYVCDITADMDGHELDLSVACEGYETALETPVVKADMRNPYIVELIPNDPPTPEDDKYVTKMGDLFPHKLSSELIVKY